MRKIAFITYETPFAPCGGIAAVIGRLPGYMQKVSGLSTIVITPYHHNIDKTVSQDVTCENKIHVPYGDETIAVKILKLKQSGDVYFLAPEDRRFFAGARHPYDVGQTQEEITEILLRDSLLFGVAAAGCLKIIDPEAEWMLMMQDWEAAPAALALAAQDGSHRLYLTLHNSYDSGAVTSGKLREFGIDPRLCPGPAGTSRATVLERALKLVAKPVFTVSEQFAFDLVEDTFQAKVMAPHLRPMLKSKLRGIDNGPFSDLAVDSAAVSKAADGEFKSLHDWKLQRRSTALNALDAHIISEQHPIWGDLSRFKRDDAPWFVMAGRDDPRQKGYDVASVAVSRFLEDGGNARFFFFTIPGDEGLGGLIFLKRLAARYPDSVLVLPFMFHAGYFATLQGASYGIMPSLYEPFGMANEFYLNGTLGIGRATGGIMQQIVPMRKASSYSRAVQLRADRWHNSTDFPTGLLYRERNDIPGAMQDWKRINEAGYRLNEICPDRVQERLKYPLFQNMASELQLAIMDAVRLYVEDTRLYYRMIAEGINYIQSTFSWDRAAAEYLQSMV